MALIGPRIRRLFRRFFGYGSVFSLAFGVTLYWSFPYVLIGQRALDDFEKRSGMKVEVEDLGPYWLTGLEAEGVTLTTQPRRKNAEPFTLVLSSLAARVHPLDSLLGPLTVGIRATADSGEISGTIQRLEEERFQMDLDVERLALGEIPDIWDRLGIGFQGDAAGTISVNVPQGRAFQLDGVADLKVSASKFGGGMIKGFTVPPVELGDVRIQLQAEEGRLTFEPPLAVDSSDLEAEVEGTIQLRQVFGASQSDLLIRFKPTDAFWKANEKVAGLAQAMINNAKGSDGFYAYEMKGRLGGPKFSPKRR